MTLRNLWLRLQLPLSPAPPLYATFQQRRLKQIVVGVVVGAGVGAGDGHGAAAWSGSWNVIEQP